MERTPEDELVIDEAQARAYAEADFDTPHSRFVTLLREKLPDLPARGLALDLGCGPADVTLCFARAYPAWEVDGVDASPAMLALARGAAQRAALALRVSFAIAHLPAPALPRPRYDLVFSKSLLHHLVDARGFWAWLRRALPGTVPLFLMDFMRPASRDEASALVDRHAGGEPDILRRDFFNSLLAAYTVDEVHEHLLTAGLDQLSVAGVSDHHLAVWGRLT